MSLLGRKPPPPSGLTPCKTGEIIAELEATNPAEADYLVHDMLGAPPKVWPTAAIAAELRREGYEVSASSVGRHRTKGCRCGTV